MNYLSKFALTILSTFAVSSAFAQCQPGQPCYNQQNSYSNGHRQDSYNQSNSQPQGRPGRGPRSMGETVHTEPPTQNADGTYTYQGLPVYMDSSAQNAAQNQGMRGSQPVNASNQAQPSAPSAGK